MLLLRIELLIKPFNCFNCGRIWQLLRIIELSCWVLLVLLLLVKFRVLVALHVLLLLHVVLIGLLLLIINSLNAGNFNLTLTSNYVGIIMHWKLLLLLLWRWLYGLLLSWINSGIYIWIVPHNGLSRWLINWIISTTPSWHITLINHWHLLWYLSHNALSWWFCSISLFWWRTWSNFIIFTLNHILILHLHTRWLWRWLHSANWSMFVIIYWASWFI